MTADEMQAALAAQSLDTQPDLYAPIIPEGVALSAGIDGGAAYRNYPGTITSPNFSFPVPEVKRMALEAALRTAQGMGVRQLIDDARAIEAYLSGAADKPKAPNA